MKGRLEDNDLERNLKENRKRRTFGAKSEDAFKDDVQWLNQARNCGEEGFRVQIPKGNQQEQSSGQIPRRNFTSDDFWVLIRECVLSAKSFGSARVKQI